MLSIKMGDSENLIIEGQDAEIEKVTRTAKYKTRIRKYVEEKNINQIILRNDVYYLKFHEIINDVEKIGNKKQISVEVDQSIEEYIMKVSSFIDYKYSIGNDIKNKDSRYIREFKKFKDIVNNQMARELRPKQMQDAFYLALMQKAGNFSVPGSGKTSTVYGTFAYLNQTKDVNQIVMIGPINSFNSWIDEFKECFGELRSLSYLNIKDYSNGQDKKWAIRYNSGGKDLILINYELLTSVEKELKEIINRNTLVVFDEVHRIKNPEGKRADAALQVTKNAKYMVALTGTPIPNGYIDIYNLLNLLYPYDYNTFFGFEPSYLKRPNSQEINGINDKIQPFFTRTNKNELGVPLANQDKIIEVESNEKEKQIFDILRSKYNKSALALFAKITQLEGNPRMLLESLDLKDFENLLDINVSDENFIDYQDYSDELKELVNKIEITSKMKALLSLVKDIVSESKTTIIWCIFVKTMYLIRDYLNEMGIKAEVISGTVNQEERTIIIDKFKKQDIDVLITNPHTLAESVSLHKSCHDAIYFEYSYNLVHLLQSKDRIHRLGLSSDAYTQYYYLQQFYEMQQGSYSLGERVYQRLSQKEQLMLDAIDNHELEILPTSDEDLEFFFKNVI
ncbi:DEAD/DEAH box helicase [Staphylococcus pettenkoferi]|uniref:DEAD/DEAH box helicase n=1 Tax=Staphylococcus pettenkoferi TaxID=170573 RepID=UPI002274F88C|nr:DEAD/DEAH box helicase [Staphylococcus pettenkoferi]MCY1573110.1 DEAD/DEAH box helicase [Staphylococcus pettenkoferi]MCY1579272.1 DEAD/DEAH box helicase [Staphylococcus pettenkoferi]